ncbi:MULTISPECIES: YkvA family protein [Geobacillus]|uniref:DUF1232 domain-containing protein n=1 Tax=Geobacillus icigianus TaxID=1430331 RepID=A0ABU6BHB3_9BACL|nr:MULTISPECIES: DUF1232 domain-containing protein [Geobacillus]KYD28787.1 hypothetical protein B4113_3584 [Geobacillus sp. B4113_201601]MEB3751332.1 hypothetical protein [Geobacillus icigianus]
MRNVWKRLRLMVRIRRFLPFLVEFFTSREVPRRKKVFSIGLLLLYVALPFDLIPDWLAVVGWIDDFTVLLFVLQRIIAIAPASLREKYQL